MARTRPRLGPVGILGAGAVGQAVAGALVVSGQCARTLVASRTPEQAAALVADLDDMRAGLGSPTDLHAVPVTGLMECEALIVAVRARFTNTRATNVRTGGARANAPVIHSLGRLLHGYTGTVLMVTNPVDVMARLFAEASGCARVFGVGSNLDSARYRLTLARLLDVPLETVDGHVIGEHGDAAVVCASATTVHGRPRPVPLQPVAAGWGQDGSAAKPAAAPDRLRAPPSGSGGEAARPSSR